MTVKSFDIPKTQKELVDFLKSSFDKAGFTDAVIGLSGGVDSAVSCALAEHALGKEHIYPILLSYGSFNQVGVVDARRVIESMGIAPDHVFEQDIKPLVDPIVFLDSDMDQTRRGNIMARVRMTVLFDQAKKRNALVVGTENKSEHVFGYYTRFGDEASDIEPLRNLYKTQVYELAQFFKIPEQILSKKPTAGLWEGQTDEGEFGFTYKDADQILSLFFDEKKSKEEIISSGFHLELVEKVLQRVTANDFKHHLPFLYKDDDTA